MPGHGLEATLDLEGHPQHTRLRIATTQQNLKESVRVETSDDARHWDLARPDALIFGIARQDRTVSDLTVEYPPSKRRYVRLTIPGWKNPALLESASVYNVSEVKALRHPVATLGPVVTQDAQTQATS